MRYPRTIPTSSALRHAGATLALSLGAAALGGCAHIGPKTIPVDRFDYSAAVADT